ncbi:MAG: hypothetical protein H0U79_01400 [Solirubrobacterales bacterium]|nr:hypothetical protein [Solirubrobacterales bacterium]
MNVQCERFEVDALSSDRQLVVELDGAAPTSRPNAGGRVAVAARGKLRVVVVRHLLGVDPQRRRAQLSRAQLQRAELRHDVAQPLLPGLGCGLAQLMRVRGWRSIVLSCETIKFVSRPDARPLSEIPGVFVS